MREFDAAGMTLCRFQADLFAYGEEKAPCSSSSFVRSFLHSSLAKRMDSGDFYFEATDVPKAYAELASEKRLARGKEKQGREILYWVGYLLRYWAYTEEMDSIALAKYVTPSVLFGVYEPYHGLSMAEAVERLKENTEKQDSASIARRIYLQK